MATFGKEILSGPLEKKAKHFPFSWQKRHFLLDERSLTYYSGAEVHTYQLRDFQDVLRKGKGDTRVGSSSHSRAVSTYACVRSSSDHHKIRSFCDSTLLRVSVEPAPWCRGPRCFTFFAGRTRCTRTDC